MCPFADSGEWEAVDQIGGPDSAFGLEAGYGWTVNGVVRATQVLSDWQLEPAVLARRPVRRPTLTQ